MTAVPVGFEVDASGRTLGSGLYVPQIERVRYHVPQSRLDAEDSEGNTTDGADVLVFDGRQVADEDHPANVYSSYVLNGYSGDFSSEITVNHAPVLDIDLLAGNKLHQVAQRIQDLWHGLGVGFGHVHFVKSTNFYHAYVEAVIPFEAYLYGVGVLVGEKFVQDFYGQMLVRRGASFVRLPGITKPPESGEPVSLDDYLAEQIDQDLSENVWAR